MESLLTTIDRLGIVKIKHLLEIHEDLKSYRNTCRVINTQLRPYINEDYYKKEKVIFLNKNGRNLIGSEKAEMKVSQYTAHVLLRNEVYIYFKCPMDWKNEYSLETSVKPSSALGISFNGLSLGNKKKVVADAVFSRNGYFHLIEVDNTRDMKDNKKKIENYREIMPTIKETPILYFYTTTLNRKRKLEEWLKGINHEVKTFEEIR